MNSGVGREQWGIVRSCCRDYEAIGRVAMGPREARGCDGNSWQNRQKLDAGVLGECLVNPDIVGPIEAKSA